MALLGKYPYNILVKRSQIRVFEIPSKDRCSIHYLFFDKYCPPCRAAVRIFQFFDLYRRCQWVPIQEARLLPGDYPYLSSRNAAHELHMCTDQGVVLHGFYALRRLLLAIPLSFLPAVLLYLPYAERIGVPLYSLISKSRLKHISFKNS
ncbi:DCC1-like thiol-disulfide oxidoreductase family protein [Marinococcus luteus]|nr:DCC1-like thiol-disulfide oxidoreductase family protein [Marinococcus luteus]